MANFPQFHGITLANNSWVENLVVETLAEDPVASGAGRVWFNSTTKTWNASFLDDLGAVVTKKFNTLEDFNSFVTNLSSTASGKGTSLVGYEGKAGVNNLFSVSASTLKSSLDSIVTELDANKKLISDITGGTGGASLVTIQSELDTTQTGAGLSATGTYVTPTTTNYLNSTTSLANADSVLDTTVKAVQDEVNTTQTGAGLSATGTYVTPTTTNYLNSTTSLANADSVLDSKAKSLQDELDTTQTGAGLESTGAYTANGTSNYITTATSLKDADNKLDAALKTEETNRTTADTAIRNDFASTATSKGASLIGIEDAGNLITATTVESAIAELYSNTTAIDFQQVYDQSPAVGGEVVVTLASDKILKFKDNNDTTYLSIDPDGTNPLKVSMSGPVSIFGDTTITGNLTVTGTTTEITSIINNADHWVISPAGSSAALVINPTVDFSGDTVVDIKAQNNGTSVLVIDKTDATVETTKLNSSVSFVANGTVTLNSTVVLGDNATFDAGANVLANIANGVANQDAVTVSQLNTVSTGIQSELDTTQTGAGLSTTGAYVVPTATNYLNSTTSLANANSVLDTTIKAVQDEVNTTQTGAGLSATGTYVVPTTTNYLNSTTSLANADATLDTTVKAVQDEVNTTQTGAGLSATGTYVVPTTTNYLNSTTSLANADATLDTTVKAVQDEVNTTQTGAGLSATGTYVVPTTTNYLNSTTSLANADATLDTTVKAVQDELDTTQTGAGLSATGTYVVPTTTNYLNSTTSLANADATLDTTVKAVQDELDTTQTGAGLSATGTYTANGTSNYITTATSLKDADDKLDAAVKSVRTDLNAQIYTLETSVAALTHTVTHNLNSAFVNYNVWIKDSEGVYHNDIVAVTETSANVLTVDLTVARNIKIAVRKVAAI